MAHKISELEESKLDFYEMVKMGKAGIHLSPREMALVVKAIAENQKAIHKLVERITILEKKLEKENR